MKILANIGRIFAGLVFLFSGFVKGVDPLGFSYKLEDYFVAFDWPFFMPYALLFAVLLCTLEFTVGAMLVLNLRMKLTAWLLLLIMVFFTFLTLNDAINNPVPDCGCFGDAIKLTNWQTFFKNIVLMVPAVIVFMYRGKFRPFAGKAAQWIIALAAAAMFALFIIWNYRHLPVIDFTEWKKGHKLYSEKPLPAKFYLTYKNKATGELKEYFSPNYPYNDSAWMASWEFASQRVEDPNEYYGKSLVITDTTGSVVTDAIIRNPGYQLVVNSYDLQRADTAAFGKLNLLARAAEALNVHTAVLTSSQPQEISRFALQHKLDIEFYNADDILLKTMVRSNPGLMLLRGGVIIDKWHCNDLPDGEMLKKIVNAAN